MKSILKVINNPRGSCADCKPTGCGTCATTPAISETPTMLTRRDLGRTVVGASAAVLLARCLSQKPAEQGSVPAQAGPPTPALNDGEINAVSLSPELAIVQESKGPIMTLIEEFYKIGPVPSSSHTMGPMRITYDFFQRVSKLPDDQLKRATALKVHLFGSLSATGKGHGTDRASLAGLLGKAPATFPPEFLDGLANNPDEVHRVTIGPATLNLTLKDVIFDSPKDDFPHPNTMTCPLFCLAWVLFGPTDVFPPYLVGLAAGLASGAAMLPYIVIKEANPPQFSGTATGVINFLNFTFSALLGPLFGWLLQHISAGAERPELAHYQAAFLPLLFGVGAAILLSFLLKETGPVTKYWPPR